MTSIRKFAKNKTNEWINGRDWANDPATSFSNPVMTAGEQERAKVERQQAEALRRAREFAETQSRRNKNGGYHAGDMKRHMGQAGYVWGGTGWLRA